jgi:hypothetical protein
MFNNFKVTFLALFTTSNKECISLINKLDIINPNWHKESPQNEKEYLEMLLELYQFGIPPKKITSSLIKVSGVSIKEALEMRKAQKR